MKIHPLAFCTALSCAVLIAAQAAEPVNIAGENSLIIGDADVTVVLRDGSELASKAKYAPPLRITYHIKTDGDIRLGYAADQIILNWSDDEKELRVNGGPADRQHITGSGFVPKNELISIVQTVFPDRMTIEVNGVERAVWKADFSEIDEQIRVFPHRSTLLVKKVCVEKIKTDKPTRKGKGKGKGKSKQG